VKEQNCGGEEVLLRKVDELKHDGLGGPLEVQVHNDFLEGLGLRRILVVLDHVVLNHLVRELPVLQFPRHDERLQLLHEQRLYLLVLE